MTWLILGLALLVGVHLVPAVPSLRHSLIRRLGHGPYKGLFSLVALSGLVLTALGMSRAPFVPVWEPPSWGIGIAPLFMLPAFILLVGAYLPGNVHRITPHPMLWGVVLWAIAHLLANGDMSGLLLFGSLGLYSLFAIWSANQRGAARATISLTIDRDLIVVGIGVVLYIGFVFMHPALFGVAAIPGI
jgi:uncharacterized membrane protein